MQAVILAGGAGTRLLPLTATRPKPILPVANVPMVRRIINHLPRDVDEIFVTVSHQREVLVDYFTAHELHRTLHVIEEVEPLGTGGALAHVRDRLTGPFLVLNGDILTNLDIAALCRFHAQQDALGTLALVKVSDPRPYGIVALRDNDIVRFVEKPQRREDAPSNLANAGVYVLDPAIFSHFPQGRASIETDVFPRVLEAGGRLAGFPFEGQWVDAGKPHAFLKANEYALQDQGEQVVLGANTSNHGARFGDWAVVGANCDLGREADVSRSVLLDRVRMADRAVVHDSILGSGVVVEADAAVIDCVVGDDALISKGVFVKGVKIEPGEHVGEVHG